MKALVRPAGVEDAPAVAEALYAYLTLRPTPYWDGPLA